LKSDVRTRYIVSRSSAGNGAIQKMSTQVGEGNEGRKSADGVTRATYKVPFAESGEVDLLVEERGEGQPFLLLHGGAGPVSMARFAGLMAGRRKTRVITPTHPGFARTKRPDALTSVRGLAQVYAAFLDRIGVSDVTVIGNSVGGWIAAELALLANPRITGVVLVGATGIDVPGHPIPDTSKLTLDEITSLSYHNPGPFRVDPTKMTEDQRAVMASNRAALGVYAPQLTDPTLGERLGSVAVPTLVISGDGDRIVDAGYGRAYAAAIPGAKFELLAGTGHLPQIETPELLLETVWKFANAGQIG
jgi:pimeloyl-ACP methyl ester carboxylesterase